MRDGTVEYIVGLEDELARLRRYETAYKALKGQIKLATEQAELFQIRAAQERMFFDDTDRAAAHAQSFVLRRLSNVVLDIEKEM